VYADEREKPRPTKKVWLVRVKVEHAVQDPWYLITDWPVEDEGVSGIVCKRDTV